MYKLSIFLLFLTSFANAIASDCPYELRGRIESDNQQAIPFAHIILQKPHQYAVADENGNFLLKNICPGEISLKISAVGFVEKIVYLSVKKNENINILLTEKKIETAEIVVRAKKNDSEQGESQSLAFLSGADLSKTVGTTLAEKLANIAGVSFLATGAGITKPVIRGLSLSRIAVFENGVKQEEQQWGADHGLQTDAENVFQAEIVKGSAALRYGGSAVGGAVNLMPPPIPQKQKINFSGDFLSANELYGISQAYENRFGKFYVRARISYRCFADSKVPANEFRYNSYILPLPENRLKNTAGNDFFANLTFGQQREKAQSNFSLAFSQQFAGIFAGAMGIPRTYQLSPDGNFRNTDFPRQNNRHIKFTWNEKKYLTKNWFLETYTAFQHNLRKEESLPHAHGQGKIPDGNTALMMDLKTFSADFLLQKDKNEENFTLGWQTQGQKNSVGGFEFLIPEYEMFKTGVFLLFNQKIHHKITLDGGLRADYSQIRTTSFWQNFYDDKGEITRLVSRSEGFKRHFFNFSAAAGATWKIAENYILKANISHSERMPDIAELASGGIHHGTFRHELGSANLRSEKGNQFNITFRKENKKWQAEFSPFVYYFSNYIFLRPSGIFSTLPEAGQVYTYTQARVFMYGGEAEIRAKIFEKMHATSVFEYTANNNFNTGLSLPFTPPMTFRQSLDYYFGKKVHLSADFLHFFAQNKTDRNESSTAAYSLFDVKLSILHKNKFLNAEWTFSVKNIADVKYINHLSRYKILNLPEQGRNFAVNVRFEI
jgi:iron complex outermembrane receptor protein